LRVFGEELNRRGVIPDAQWMRLALKLAARGRGRVEPNPMVGAVIVRGGRLVGKGHHRRFGGPHAEIEAIRDAGGESRCTGATLYVTLEPCCHYGKTPPCTDAIVRAGFSRVLVAVRDPFHRVRGRGLRILRRAGLRVETGLLQEEARALNAAYLKLRAEGIPWFIAKWAMTADGKLATRAGDSRWISCEASRRFVHRLRARVDAVMIGVGTALRDDPLLQCYLIGGRNPRRIVVDSHAHLPVRSRLVRTARSGDVLVAVTAKASPASVRKLEAAGCRVLRCRAKRGEVDLRALARQLGRMELTNVLVEGGSRLLGCLLDEGLVDEVVVFVAPKVAGGEGAITPVGGVGVGRIVDALSLRSVEIRRIGSDVMLRGRLR
jgi:diaminohydroxyphosphoribosylaminopyrimidine deaminase/5-amino-6-(5-phosphoribosylamino)uracil reductase